ncbi:MAG: MBL fold metallo-hydrolase [Thermodesulfobacteria bacterium]|nr:MBL fold metallo-hydrolase [Thermodesulfobacteriota bacterium]
MELVIVFDNYALAPCAQAGWGYACYFPERGLLFDTGSETGTLVGNLKCLGIDPREIRTILLSHAHWDHAGGLLGLLERDRPREVILHRGFSPRFAGEITRLGGQVVFNDSPAEILPGFFTTGLLPAPTPETGLIVRGEKGLSLITGCAHPGIVSMVQRTLELFRTPPRLVMGGFHLGNLSLKRLREIVDALRALGVETVAPSHCTGEKARELFAETFGRGFIRAGIGLRLDL